VTGTVSRESWAQLINAISGRPTAGILARALADARELPEARAFEIVTEALDDGQLLEEDTGGPFPNVTLPDVDDETLSVVGDVPPSNPTSASGESAFLPPDEGCNARSDWSAANFARATSDTYPPALLEREQWMGRRGKLPFSPWAERDHPEADPDKDARYKWGLSENYATGGRVALAEDDSRLDGRVLIQLEDDPFAFVDGDDVRCPETGEVHPDFVQVLGRLGVTYADVSTSGTGVHAYYQGALPNDQSQAVFEIDAEPWGANDDAPTVEIYAGKHVNVATGEHVHGTPLDVNRWDDDGLRAVLKQYDALKEPTPTHDTDQDREDLADYEPTASTHDERTDDIRDVLKAVDRLRPRDLRLRTSKVGADGNGWQKWDPSSYRTSSGNDSLHCPVGEAVFYDQKHGEGFGLLSLLAAEEGIISNPWDRLDGADWWDTITLAREQGAPIPEYVGGRGEDVEHVAVFPPAVRDLTQAASGWDWRHTAESGARDLSINNARERTVTAIADAYTSGDRVLVEALPTMGKSYGAVKAAADTDDQVTILTGRGLKEQYQQFRDWCDEHGLSHYTLPSFKRDCDTANGEHGEDWASTADGWYNRGATPKQIHAQGEYVLGHPLPCQQHEGRRCPYASKWDFDPDDYDVLIGHYAHAHKQKVTGGRTVVFDEFPDAYETHLGARLQSAVSSWLKRTDGVPFDDYTDLIEHRSDQSRHADALLWFDEHGIEPDETGVFDDTSAHATAPLAVFTLLASDDLGNGFERASLHDGALGTFDREQGNVSLLRPPNLKYASGVVALDGTPTKRMWELALGERLNHRPVLQSDERAEYVRDALNLNLVRTTDAVKPYNSADHVNTDQDGALLEAIREQHGERPSLITTSTAKGEYDKAGLLNLVDETKHYGNVLGSNEFDDTRLGAVIGSNHYGDGYIKKWGAYAGEAVERNDEKGAGLSYGTFGDDVLTHMREHDTLQASMRFGRDGNGAVVYVHTDTLPEWVPLAGEGRVLSTWSDGMRDVIEALEDLETATTAEVVEHPAVDLSRQQVFKHLEGLRERGVLAREQDAEDGRRMVWTDDGLHRLGEHGEADLEPVEWDDLTDAEVRQVVRTSYYTWDLTKIDSDSLGASSSPAEEIPPSTGRALSGGDDPPSRS
jgi:hypothetical protein